MLIDQLGSYLVLSTVGIALAGVYAAQGLVSGRAMLRKVLTLPPFIAMLLALALRPLELPPVVDRVLLRLGDTPAPLALLSVGLQLRVDAQREHLAPLGLGLAYKLVVCPAMVVGVLWWLDADPTMRNRVSVIEAAMPPMIGAPLWHALFAWLSS